MVGEASISLATACFGHGVNGNSGHDKNDVLHIAFPGSKRGTVPHHAAWSAKSLEEFAASSSDLGDQLISRLSWFMC